MIEIESKTIDKLVANVRIEANHQMNGSHELRKNPQLSHLPDANYEEGEGEEVSPLAFVSPLAYKLICHLEDKRITKDMLKNMDPNLRVTKGMFMIKYVPKTDKRYKKGRPWVIGQDLIRMGIHVSGYKHWNYLCDKIPELDWIRRNSTMNTPERMQRMFDLAVMHPGMTFWFSVDWPAYYDKLAAQPGPKFRAGAGADVEEHPFATHKCSVKEYKDHYKDKVATLRVLNDVLKEVQEVEASPAVQEEMLKVTGETAVTRKDNVQPKDPATGRFISRNKNQEEK